MKCFIPMRDDMLYDPAMAMLPLVPFQLDFACLRDMGPDGSERIARDAVAGAESAFSGGSPGYRPV